MADKAISELVTANQVAPTDLFILEQSGVAKKLTGNTLENWLLDMADGHGGIQSIAKASTSGLVDTYRITFADTSTYDFTVTNGKSITKIANTKTSGLVDTYTITFNDSTTSTFTVTNGAQGEKGDSQYVWIKYASQEPTESSHSFGDITDNWIGIYSGDSATAPSDWTAYNWFEIKGAKGDTGAAASLVKFAVDYQVSDSGTIIPSGAWVASVPVVAQGKYLWTRTTNTFNSGSPVISYSVSRMGLDGSGSVSSVANVSPGEDGNVPLTAAHLGALPVSGGVMTGPVNMNGQTLNGLNAPTEDDEAATKGYVDASFEMDVIWENVRPDDDFDQQTLNVDCSPYRRILVVAKASKSSPVHTTSVNVVGEPSSIVGSCYDSENSAIFVGYRPFDTNSKTKIIFNKVVGMSLKGSTISGVSANITYMIPIKIYGIK